MEFIDNATRYLFFTGKGGVGKTSLSSATSIALADSGKNVLLVSTDPASNLDEVLGVKLSSTPTFIGGVPGLWAMNIDPEVAARDYRERIVGPYRGVLPDAALISMEEQLSGACTVEIAAFDEFSKLLGDYDATAGFDHVIFDTAPTGHTLRLLKLPAAWSGFLESNTGGTSCLGPLAGLQAQRELYAATLRALTNPAATTLVLVSRPEESTLAEADRTRAELSALGVVNQHLVLNGVFKAQDPEDGIARALEARGRSALDRFPKALPAFPARMFPCFLSGLWESMRYAPLQIRNPHRPVPLSGGLKPLGMAIVSLRSPPSFRRWPVRASASSWPWEREVWAKHPSLGLPETRRRIARWRRCSRYSGGKLQVSVIIQGGKVIVGFAGRRVVIRRYSSSWRHCRGQKLPR